tara:strand:+ start:338 stop:673 length:336 start_codon:yes stop_codon:yes gene_type:complete
MDLSLLIASDTADCVIVDPKTNEATNIVVTCYGVYSDEYQKAIKKRESAKDSSSMELLIDLTVGWKNLSYEGKKLEFNRENALLVYSMKGMVVKNQVEAFILEQNNFLPKR